MLPSRHADRLTAYADLVRRWAGKLDLVSPGDLARFESRHIADSLRALDLLADLPEGAGVDVGSGAGLPGIPLAVCDSRHSWRLLEPRARRAAFLDEVVRLLELECEVIAMTAEEASRDRRLARAHVVATARALAAPEVAAERLRPLLAEEGTGVLWLGERASRPRQSRAWREGIAIIRGAPQGPNDDFAEQS
ncbi:hypothetical protein BH18ACT15_BH18ACT15_14960 [soil metagenome]